MNTDKQAPRKQWPFPPRQSQEKPQREKGLDTERVGGRTAGTEPPKDKRIDDL
jgi:hypothetical protein